MRKTLALIGIVASAFTVSSVSASPNSLETQPVVTVAPKAKHAVTAAAPKRAVYYITSVGATGSHLPLVVCHYNGAYYSQSPIAVYSRPQLDQTGHIDVIGELLETDPALSRSMGHR